MNLPPLMLDLRVASSTRRPVHLWLPLFLLWPLALALGVVALAVAVVVDAVLLLVGRRYHRYSLLLVRSLTAICETRGMVIRVSNEKSAVDMTVQ
jgi:hypothetical protein